MLGAPHRIRYLRESLQDLACRDGVYLATAGEIAAEARRRIG
jgi:hypothetical protein